LNRLFAELVERHTPRYNPDVMNGLACLYVPLAQEWLDGIFRSAAKSFPKGLTYDGCERCTPYEEYAYATRLHGNKRTFDLAESDLFLLKLKFSFEDDEGHKEALPFRYMYMPFVNEADIFRISGTMYHVTGVLSDKVISPGMNSIFVRLIRDRLTFRHIGHSVMVGNRRETFNVVWSGIYRKPTKERSAPVTTQANSSIAHYLFARYGFTETFRKYAGFVPTVGHYSPGQTFSPNTIVCRSSYYGTHSKPNTFIQFKYQSSDLYLEIPEKHWNSATASLVAGFFYVVDHFPDRFVANRLDSTFLWSILLGNIIFSGVYSEAKLFESIDEHFKSLDDYLDIIVHDKLREIGWNVENFYDLIAKIMIDFPNLLLGGQINVNSMFNKTVEILYYMLAEIAFKIFKVNYQLRKSRSKKPLTIRSVTEAFNKIMTPRTIFRITKDKMIVETVSYCGDHKYFKLTSKITEQESGSSRYRRKSKRVTLNESNHIDASMVEGGNVLFLSKSNPMPNTRINPYVTIDRKTGTLLPNPEFTDVLANLQSMLTRTNNFNPEDLSLSEEEFDVEKPEDEPDDDMDPEEIEIYSEADLDDESD